MKSFEDTLCIWTRFKDCKTSGGHNEVIKIYVRSDGEYFTYRRDTLDPKETDFTAARLPYKLDTTETMWVSKKRMAALRKHAHQLLDAEFQEVFPGNTGCIFDLRRMNDGLGVNVYSDDAKLVKAYTQFRDELLR